MTREGSDGPWSNAAFARGFTFPCSTTRAFPAAKANPAPSNRRARHATGKKTAIDLFIIVRATELVHIPFVMKFRRSKKYASRGAEIRIMYCIREHYCCQTIASIRGKMLLYFTLFSVKAGNG
jgi:hypothetical protein